MHNPSSYVIYSCRQFLTYYASQILNFCLVLPGVGTDGLNYGLVYAQYIQIGTMGLKLTQNQDRLYLE